MSKVVWSLPEHDDALVNNLAEELGISETVARILVNRGVRTVSDAHAFMSPSLDQMHDPMLLPDMEAGVERVVRALEAKEKILIHGDYDVDGVSSTALLVRVFTKLGANVVHRIPHRKRDGYDIKPYTAEEAKA
ncbi:MAG TPA: single-stranded-DNA-specific exonuclease RecJ, partial [Armatimonadota bacterium]|nr:single-stranded-DNA-specific exonuclease RecJ [Armatimonadota bacterium]